MRGAAPAYSPVEAPLHLFSKLALLGSLLLSTTAIAGAKASDFSLRDLAGDTVTLSELEGKVIYVDFWATWCGPCKDEMPHLQKMATELKDKGFMVIAISTDDARTQAQVKPFIRRMGYDFTVVKDPNSEVLVAYNPAKTLPFGVLINREGEIIATHQGYNEGDEVHLREEVVEALSPTVKAPAAPVPADPAPADPAPADPAE